MMRERDIYLDALDIVDPTERAAFVDENCGDNEMLATRLRAMLKQQGEEDDFLSEERLQSHELDASRMGGHEGATIDKYKLLEEVGEGGFGIVYRAEQTEPLVRNVAVKIIKPGMDTRQVIARFEAERRTLALMDHPHIATVLDGGTTDQGRPYFVMELVDGIPITEFCDENRLNTTERLRLFVKVCQAIQHAHQRGIIHRDIKPSNVLVTRSGEEVIPRVIDFGVAKAIGEDTATDTRFTGQGQTLGTPQYMSPEQADFSSLDVDTRSDVYSLGILLYEMLTGCTPLGQESLQSLPRDEVCRLVREQDAVAPSSKIATVGEAAETIGQNRRSDPHRLRQLLRRELDWITLKALHKQRDHRYASPSALVDDIERFLAGQPVAAGPPGAMYRVQKYVRRNGVMVFAVTAIAASLLVGMTTTFVTLRQLRSTVAALESSRDEVAEQVEIATFNFELITHMLLSVEADPNAAVIDMLDQFVGSDLPTRLKDQRPEARAALRLLIGKLYARLGEQHFAQQFFQDAVKDRREQGDQSLLAAALTESAENLYCCCQYSHAYEAAGEAVTLFDDSTSEYGQHARVLADSAKAFVDLRSDVWQVMSACGQSHQEEARRIKRELQAYPERKPMGVLNGLLTMLFADVEDFAFAEEVCRMHSLRDRLALRSSTSGALPALVANAESQREFGLGFLAQQQDKPAEARKHYHLVLEQMRGFPVRNRDNDWVESLYSWALLHQESPSNEDVLEAERRAQVAIAFVEERQVGLPTIAALAHHALALAKSKRGDLAAAIASQEMALQELQRPDVPRQLLLQLVVEEQLARYHVNNADPSSAQLVANHAIDWRTTKLKLTPDHPHLRRATSKLAKFRHL